MKARNQETEAQSFLPKHKFLTLDALRGVAALAVVQFHESALFRGRFFPRGYLAVDFFFLLSGFVITFAYQRKLDQGWPASAFLKARLVRLYPLYIFGLVLGLVAFAVRYVLTGQAISISQAAKYFVLGVFVVPVLSFARFPAIAAFPLNFPTWSLFGETIANIVHAVFLRRRSSKFLASVTIASGIFLVACIVKLGTIDIGEGHRGILFAIPRAIFSYCAGIFIYKKWGSALSRIRVPAFLPCALLLAILMIPQMGRYTAFGDCLVIFLVFPALLLLGARTVPGVRLVWIFRVLGTVSYAIYVLHAPLAMMFDATWLHVASHSEVAAAPWSGFLFASLTVTIALSVDRLYDVPVRSYLRRVFGA